MSRENEVRLEDGKKRRNFGTLKLGRGTEVWGKERKG
jgi:hypothetical protein